MKIKYNQKYAENLTKIISLNNNLRNEIEKFILQNLEGRKKILSLGCGNLDFEKKIIDNIRSVKYIKAIEKNPHFFKKNLNIYKKIEFTKGDYTKIKNFKKYDCILFKSSLHFIPNPMKYLEKIHKKIRKKTKIIVQFPNHLFNFFTLNEGTYNLFQKDYNLKNMNYKIFKDLLKYKIEVTDFSIYKRKKYYPLNPLQFYEFTEINNYKLLGLKFFKIHSYPMFMQKSKKDINTVPKNTNQKKYTRWKNFFNSSVCLVNIEKQ